MRWTGHYWIIFLLTSSILIEKIHICEYFLKKRTFSTLDGDGETLVVCGRCDSNSLFVDKTGVTLWMFVGQVPMTSSSHFFTNPYFFHDNFRLLLTEGGTYPQLPTQPKLFCTLQADTASLMVTLSCLAKKNQNLTSRKKSSVYYWKYRFV